MATYREFKRAYIWQLPVRLTHWISALTIFILAATGIIISNPPAIMSGNEASYSYWFGIVRFIHFATAYVFCFSIIVRLYWSFVGNKYSSWRVFFPWKKSSFRKMKHVMKVDILLQNEKESDYTSIAVGHNPVAALSYFVLYLLCAAQILTGFALLAPTSTWFFPKLFAWVTGLFGNEFTLRSIHHAVTWLMIIFTLIHVYLVFYHDWLEGRGEVSSMFSGYKFVAKERLKGARGITPVKDEIADAVKSKEEEIQESAST
jgi:Ni/Fe-hydrogenase 1 B-type cytochrome subunit